MSPETRKEIYLEERSIEEEVVAMMTTRGLKARSTLGSC